MFNLKLNLRLLLLTAFLHCAADGAFPTPLVASPKCEQTIRTLDPGSHVEREIAPGETHVYEVSVEEDRYLQFFSDHPGLRAEMKLLDPEGKLLSSLDNIAVADFLNVQGISVNAGRYRLEMRAFRTQPTGGLPVTS